MTVSKADYPAGHPSGIGFADYDTNYLFYFHCKKPEDLRVVHVDTEVTVLVYAQDYEVYHDSDYIGGYIKLFEESGITGGRIYISRRILKEQRQHWTTQAKLLLPHVEGAADRLNLMLQDMEYQVAEYFKKSRYRGAWATGRYYITGDLSRDGVNLYIAITEHVAASTLASDVTAGNQQKFYDGDAMLAAWANVPTIGAGDSNKIIRVNSGETDLELGHLVPKPATGNTGKIPIVNIGANDYEGFFDRNAQVIRPSFYYNASEPKKIHFTLPYRTNHHEWGPVWSDPSASPNYLAVDVPDVASTWSYLYVTGLRGPTDYSSRILRNDAIGTDFTCRTDAPSYDAAKGGWYYYDSTEGLWYQAIFPIYLTASKEIRPFQHNTTNRLVWWHDEYLEYNASMPASWTTVTFARVPPVCQRALAEHILIYGSGTAKYLRNRPGGSTHASGTKLNSAGAGATSSSTQYEVFLASSQCSYIVINGPASVSVLTLGWYLPKGM